MMNQSKKKIDLEDYRSLEKIAYKNLLWIIENSSLFRQPEHFSLVQYGNQTVLKNHIKGALEQLKHLDPKMSYLNIGMGTGILEAVAESQHIWNIDSVEWIEQEKMFSQFHQELGIDNYCKYLMEDVHSDQFELKVEELYDYSLFIRFFPINKKWCKDIKDVIRKFQKVSKGFIIIDHVSNFVEWELLEEKADHCKRMGSSNFSLLRFDSIDNFLTQI